MVEKQIDQSKIWDRLIGEEKSLQAWIDRMKTITEIKFKTEKMEQEIQFFKSNQEWILRGLQFMDFENRKSNSATALKTLIESLYQNKHEFAIQMLSDLESIQS